MESCPNGCVCLTTWQFFCFASLCKSRNASHLGARDHKKRGLGGSCHKLLEWSGCGSKPQDPFARDDYLPTVVPFKAFSGVHRKLEHRMIHADIVSMILCTSLMPRCPRQITDDYRNLQGAGCETHDAATASKHCVKLWRHLFQTWKIGSSWGEVQLPCQENPWKNNLKLTCNMALFQDAAANVIS